MAGGCRVVWMVGGGLLCGWRWSSRGPKMGCARGAAGMPGCKCWGHSSLCCVRLCQSSAACFGARGGMARLFDPSPVPFIGWVSVCSQWFVIDPACVRACAHRLLLLACPTPCWHGLQGNGGMYVACVCARCVCFGLHASVCMHALLSVFEEQGPYTHIHTHLHTHLHTHTWPVALLAGP